METTIERKIPTRPKGVILFDKILTDFIADRNKKSLKDLKGKISFIDDYDYKGTSKNSFTSLRAERSNPEGKGTMLILILDCFAPLAMT